MADGETSEYELSKEAVESALAYAADVVATTEVIPLVGA